MRTTPQAKSELRHLVVGAGRALGTGALSAAVGATAGCAASLIVSLGIWFWQPEPRIFPYGGVLWGATLTGAWALAGGLSLGALGRRIAQARIWLAIAVGGVTAQLACAVLPFPVDRIGCDWPESVVVVLLFGGEAAIGLAASGLVNLALARPRTSLAA
jgi:hypothetical protein